MNYVYDCKNETKKITDDHETKVLHKRYFVVTCNECSNIPVCHLVRRENEND
jgi:hypothetical protein